MSIRQFLFIAYLFINHHCLSETLDKIYDESSIISITSFHDIVVSDNIMTTSPLTFQNITDSTSTVPPHSINSIDYVLFLPRPATVEQPSSGSSRSENSWSLMIKATHAQIDQIELGMQSNATNAFDPSLDELTLQDEASQGRIEIHYNELRLTKDFRNITTSATWLVEAEATDAQSLILDWDSVSISPGSLFLRTLYPRFTGKSDR